jgi:MoaA/NifB/PqqE/SkfB family radical SAM enzyme
MKCPFIVTYSFTRLCNLKCRHCYSNGGTKGEHELSPDKARDVVKEVAEAGSRIIIFDGGEPLMREDIYQLISLGKSLGLTTVLGTNGTLITPSVAGKLLDAGLDHCAVSIDGSTPQTHEWLRGVEGCFEKAVNGARLIREAGIPLQINACLHSRNQNELQDIIRLAEALSADAVQFFLYVEAGRGSQDIMPPSLLPDAFENVKGNIDIRLIGTTQQRSSKCCTAADKVCCILNDGTVYPCMLLPVSLGNVMENSLSDIWNNSTLIMKIKESKKGKFKGMELCRVWK